VWIVLLAWLLLREPMSGRKAVGVTLTFAGVGCMLA
jgi:drug/metabolite transporter (DMT)-like permease